MKRFKNELLLEITPPTVPKRLAHIHPKQNNTHLSSSSSFNKNWALPIFHTLLLLYIILYVV